MSAWVRFGDCVVERNKVEAVEAKAHEVYIYLSGGTVLSVGYGLIEVLKALNITDIANG
jgi:hypothetical protein